MATNSNSNSTSSTSSDEMLAKMMEQGMNQLSKADKNAQNNGGDDKTVKLFGLLEVPEMFATVAEGLWNEGADTIAKWAQRNTHTKFKAGAEAIGLHGNAATRTAAGATIALSAAIKSAVYINPVVEAFRKQHRERKALVEKAAPVLDALKGKHSVGALMGVKEQDNEMIFYARKRLMMTTRNDIGNNVTKLILNVAPNMMLDIPGYKSLWKGEATELESMNKEDLKGWGGRITRMGMAPVANALMNSRTRKLNRTLATPYSALEMALELAEQVENNPNASNFQLPGRGGKSLSLEQYIEQICLTHQKNMAEISNDHVEIRDALKEDLKDAIKPLAKAIRGGEMDAMGLIHLIGEGKIIKGKGRAVANPAAIEALIEKQAAAPVKQAHVDPKDYYKGTPYTKDELKTALGALEGEEKDFFVALLPDEVLADLGLSKDEIKTHRDAATGHYHRSLADALVGIAEVVEDDKTLAQSEKKTITKAEAAIADKGEEAVKALHGQHIEQTVLNWAVPKILGDKAHFGTVLAKGHEKFAAMQDGDSDTLSIRKKHTKEYADRVGGGHENHRERHNARHEKGSESYIE